MFENVKMRMKVWFIGMVRGWGFKRPLNQLKTIDVFGKSPQRYKINCVHVCVRACV